MRDLYIDLETFSDVDLTSCGLHRYAGSNAFEILLFGFAFDDEPVKVIDTASGERVPHEVLDALFNDSVIKHSYNAVFEIVALRRAGLNTAPAQWRCSMLHTTYAGYPLKLRDAGAAAGLPADEQKLSFGQTLIRTFCVPCKPAKANGWRTRNLPRHDPAKWELFKQYNARDVETERALDRRLRSVIVPDDVQQQWLTDLTINLRGVPVDLRLVTGALELSARSTAALTEEAVALSGIVNPNSVKQLVEWLNANTDEDTEVTTLRKADVQELLGGATDDTVRRMLEIRQLTAKTSLKKYDAIAATVCEDGRIRGLLQFYGANRTGRWAGRFVQMQNLPQNHLPALELARELVKHQDYEGLQLMYGSVPSALSQLIRTAFVASPGKCLIVADYSAIEARVIAWLAGEQWVLDVFNTHGKIYEAQAAQMFGVPIESVTKGSDLRQKGKVATLALGFQGGSNALIAMGALNAGLTEAELPEVVQRWRKANKRIVELWYALERAVADTIRTGRQTGVKGLIVTREADADNGQDFLTIRLPSGRKLYYVNPFIVKDTSGRERMHYYGVNDKGKWGRLDTYGGKLVENVVQAIARDCLALTIERLTEAGYQIIFHVHDEVIIEAEHEELLKSVLDLMSQDVLWAPGLPLRADGFVTEFYKKD